MEHNSSNNIVIDPEGLRHLRRPLLPLARMVHFFLATGAADNVAGVLAQLPARIDTEFACYDDPARLLRPFLPLLDELLLEAPPASSVVAEDNTPLEPVAARLALIWQALLERELETINSLLCAPCDCTLCCTGPARDMEQDYFFIPLAEDELPLFPLSRISLQEQQAEGREPGAAPEKNDFSRPDPNVLAFLLSAQGGEATPCIVRRQQEWLLALPRGHACPQLSDGRCRCYAERPRVCRRPQLFPYLLEPLPTAGRDAGPAYRLRHALRAVSDCPYVAALRQDIADYAAACELTLYFGPNKG